MDEEKKATQQPIQQVLCVHDWWLTDCDGGDWDTLTCIKCGKEKTVRCSFDDDMA